LNLVSLSRYTFTPQQSQFILDFLRNQHIDVYNNIMQSTSGNDRPPLWWKQSNTSAFRNLLRNAP
jgi:hypothetical protein